jgi:cell shape-determining protein MreC
MDLPSLRPSRGALFGGLMVLSALALLLPPAWSSPIKHVAQLLVPPQDLLYTLTHRAAGSISRGAGAAPPPPAGRDDPLRAENAAQYAEILRLQEENSRLRALRAGEVPLPMPILPARIVARDIVAGRDSALLARGSVRGARWNDWVTSRFFIDQGLAAEAREGQAVLTQQSLLGRIEQVSPYMSRVQLLSDVDSPRLEVRIGGRADGRLELVDYPCSLRGAGRQTMLIEGVDYRYVDASAGEPAASGARRIRTGDFVFSAPGQLGLPSPMVVGRVARMAEDPRKRLVYNLTVEPVVRLEEVRQVYVSPLVTPAGLPGRP